MAGAGYKLFNTGDVLTAAQVNTYLQEQTVMVFASSTARTTALSGVLAEGMVSYLQDTNAVEVYNGSAWVGVSGAGDVTEVQAGTGISVASGTGPIPVVTNTMATAINAAGDIIYGTANDTFTRLGIGTAGQVLKVNSGATAPEWGAAAGGYTLVSRQTYTSAGTITLDNIFSTTYENYQIVLLMGNSNETADLTMKFRYGASPTTQSLYYNWDYQINAANGGTSTVGGSEDGSNIRIVADTGSQLAVHMFISSFSDRLWGGFFATGYSNNAGAGPNGYRGNFNNRFARSGADAYHGLLFELSAGTATGNISIYGQAK